MTLLILLTLVLALWIVLDVLGTLLYMLAWLGTALVALTWWGRWFDPTRAYQRIPRISLA